MIKIDWKNWVINKPENLSSLCACDYASSHSCSTTFKLNYLNVFNYIAASAKWLGSFRRSEFSFFKYLFLETPRHNFRWLAWLPFNYYRWKNIAKGYEILTGNIFSLNIYLIKLNTPVLSLTGWFFIVPVYLSFLNLQNNW